MINQTTRQCIISQYKWYMHKIKSICCYQQWKMYPFCAKLLGPITKSPKQAVISTNNAHQTQLMALCWYQKYKKYTQFLNADGRQVSDLFVKVFTKLSLHANLHIRNLSTTSKISNNHFHNSHQSPVKYYQYSPLDFCRYFHAKR